MITAVVTFVTTRIVAVVVTTVVVVAAVPTVIIAIHGNTITVTAGPASAARQGDRDEKARLIVEVKTAGDDVVTLLNQEEATCDSQLTQLGSVSTLSLVQTNADIDKGKGEFHSDVAKFEKEIKDDEDGFDGARVISTQTEEVVLTRLLQVRITALGENETTGVLITSCQTIVVEIRQIVITVTAPSSDDEDSD